MLAGNAACADRVRTRSASCSQWREVSWPLRIHRSGVVILQRTHCTASHAATPGVRGTCRDVLCCGQSSRSCWPSLAACSAWPSLAECSAWPQWWLLRFADAHTEHTLGLAQSPAGSCLQQLLLGVCAIQHRCTCGWPAGPAERWLPSHPGHMALRLCWTACPRLPCPQGEPCWSW